MELTGLEWRKSSRSGTNGGQCVEVAAWRKSSRSGPNGGECVEVGLQLPGGIAVRDSKDPDGPVLAFAPDAWRTFTTALKRQA